MTRRSSLSGLVLVLVILGVVAFWSVAAAQTGADLSAVSAVVSDSTAKAKEIAVGIIAFLSALLAIAVVIMLFKRVGGNG